MQARFVGPADPAPTYPEALFAGFRQRFVAGIAPDRDALAKLRMERP